MFGVGVVPLRFRLIDCLSLIHHLLRYLRTLYLVWNQVRRRVTRRLTRLQTMCNVLKHRKIIWNGSVRLRFGCGYFFNLLKFSTVNACISRLLVLNGVLLKMPSVAKEILVIVVPRRRYTVYMCGCIVLYAIIRYIFFVLVLNNSHFSGITLKHFVKHFGNVYATD